MPSLIHCSSIDHSCECATDALIIGKLTGSAKDT